MAVVVILITTVTIILFAYLRIFSSSDSAFNTNRWEEFFFVFTFRQFLSAAMHGYVAF